MISSDRLPQLRVTVNATCGRACFYCRPSGEAITTDFRKELNPDDLINIAEECLRHGIRSIKLTGGDPALWLPLIEVVRRLKQEVGFEEVHIISRHPKIGNLASELFSVGTDLINISIDTLNPKLHHNITGINDLSEVIAATQLAIASKVNVKVNTVVMAGVNDHEIEDLVLYFESIGISELKLLDVIQDLDAGNESFSHRLLKHNRGKLSDLYVPLLSIIEKFRLRAVSEEVVNQGGLGHPMIVLKLPSGMKLTIKDHSTGVWYGSICNTCSHFPCHDALMALRLTADLRLQFCLLREDISVDLKPILANNPLALHDEISRAFDIYRNAEFFKQIPALNHS
jgi:cyclic pyranopterin phosphate synthase